MPRVRTVRKYKGLTIPWVAHDCDSTESCRYCRYRKREFIRLYREVDPQVGPLIPSQYLADPQPQVEQEEQKDV